MQRIYEPQDVMEGELLLGMLASEGIAAYLTGQHLAGAAGDLPALSLLGLMVDDDQAHSARELIAAYNAAQPMPEEGPEDYHGSLLC